MSLELLCFEGQAPVAPAEASPASTAADEVLRPSSAGTRLLALPARAAAAGSLALQSVGRTIVRRTSRDAPDPLTVLRPAEARLFVDATGARIRKGVIYARHPKAAKSNTVVAAPTFHQHVIKEQIAEIIRYLRSELHMSSVRITVRSEKTGKVLVGSTFKGVPILARLGVKADQSITLEQKSHKPKRVRSSEPYVWIDDFPELKAAAKSARHGQFVATQLSDLSFGLSLPAAKFANISADWLSSFQFIVEAEYR